MTTTPLCIVGCVTISLSSGITGHKLRQIDTAVSLRTEQIDTAVARIGATSRKVADSIPD